MAERARRELLQVSAGLSREGGGTAVMARQTARVAADFAAAAGLKFRILTLGADGDDDLGLEVRSFGGNQKTLALAVWRRQLSGTCAGIVFDHPGVARTQAFLPRGLRSPYLVWLYGIDIWRRQGWQRRRSLRHAAELLTISEFSKRRAESLLSAGSRIQVIYPALEAEDPTGAADARTLEVAGENFLLIVGRMASGERYKGHDQLVRALPEIVVQAPKTRLVVVGEGDDRRRLEALAAEIGMSDRVSFTGFVDEATLRALYERCLAFVMPSTEEGFGLVYLEAMRAGKPCVAATGGAPAEIVVDGETGILVEPDDRNQLTSACVTLVSKPDVRRLLGQQGRRRWQERFGFEAFRTNLERRLSVFVE